MSDQPPKFDPSKLREVAEGLGQLLAGDRFPTVVEEGKTRSERAKTPGEQEQTALRRGRDLLLLREQIEDLAGQAWTLYWRYEHGPDVEDQNAEEAEDAERTNSGTSTTPLADRSEG